MPDPLVIEGSLNLVDPVDVDTDCLGRRIRGSTETGTFVLFLPAANPFYDDVSSIQGQRLGLRYRERNRPPQLSAPTIHDPDTSHWEWGFYRSPTSVAVRSLGIRLTIEVERFTTTVPARLDEDAVRSLDLDDPDTQIEFMRGEVSAWWRLMTHWLECWTGQLISVERTLVEGVTITGRALVDGSEATVPPPMGPMDFSLFRRLGSSHRRGTAATPAMLTGAARRADRLSAPPLEWQMLLNARRSGEARTAVIDAAAAAEICLSTYARSSLTKTRVQGLAEHIEKRRNGLMPWVELAKDLGWIGQVDRTDLQKKVSEPRNRAAHRGEVPSATEKEACLEQVEKLLTQLCPMNPPQARTRRTRTGAGRE